MEERNKIAKMLTYPDKVVGTRQVLRGMSEGMIRCAIIAEDADAELVARLAAAAEGCGAEILTAPDMAWLGEKAGIEVRAAVVGICKASDIH